ncbi:hypothetical protein B7463_g452, partial [Scytalidium lignicola]
MAKRSREVFEPCSETSDLVNRLDFQNSSNAQLKTENISAISPKILHLDIESGEATSQALQMHCSLPPHRDTLIFTSYEEHEVHYNKFHVNRCVECRKNFPTNHFLNLHIEEYHDPLILVKRERGDKTYSCYVEDCDRKFATSSKRRLHLIDKHLFPKEYNFFVTVDGIDNQSSMLQLGRHRRRSSAAQNKAHREDRARRRNSSAIDSVPDAGTEYNQDHRDGGIHRSSTNITPITSKKDEDMEDLSSAMSALKVVPLSIRFGRGGSYGRGFARK